MLCEYNNQRGVLVLIKITKYLRVNVLTIALFVFCIIFNKADMLCVTYAVMILHELAHCLAAVCIGLKISHIDFYPFGVNLKLKNKLVYSLADEMILYFSGPFCNILFALIAMIVYSRYPNESVKIFYISNTMLFCMNMIPSVPLDGGILLKKIIAYRLGYNSANKIMTVISAVFSAMIMGLGIYVMYITKFNFSVLLFSALMIGNIFTQSEKYNVDLIKTLMFNNKKKKSVRHIVVENECNYCDIVDKFIPKDYNMVYVVSDDGKVKDIITETQVIDKLTTEQVL